MAVTNPPRWHLAPAVLTPREGIGVFLQDPDPIPPVLPVEVRAHAVLRDGGSRAAGEGARSLLCCLQKSRVVHLGLVYCLADRQPTPVNYRLGPVHAAAVCRHGPCG